MACNNKLIGKHRRTAGGLVTTNPFSTVETRNFFSPNKIMLGPGAVGLLGREAAILGAKKALLVVDQGVKKTGMTETVKESLASSRIEVLLFDGVELETPASVIDEGARICKENGCDLVIALGGGTTLDTTKGISLMATNEGSVLDYVGVDLVPIRGLSKLMVPTTAGSGSEVSRVFGVTDDSTKIKKAVSTPFNLAQAVILDPLLTRSLPSAVTAETGIDALCHATEAYVSLLATPFSDVLALEGIRLVGKSLLLAFAKGENIEARSDMLLAATFGGLAFSSGGLGAVHAFSFALEMRLALSHARAISVIMPHIMEYNKIGAPHKYGNMARVLGERVEGLTDLEAAGTAVAETKRLLEIMGISYRLRDYGMTEAQIPDLVETTMGQGRLFAANPRNLTEQDVRGIYFRAL
jgi:alcohol dehydrogenase class IV